jgi:large-conductance mechanosensitive channel
MNKNKTNILKLIFLIFLFSSFFLSLHLVSSLTILGGTPLINPASSQDENLENPIDKFHEVEQTSSEKIDNLMQQWQELLLKNEFLKELDNSFKKINMFFFVLFGEDYSFSLYFFLIFVFWLFLLISFYYVIRTYSTFSEFASAFISFSLILTSSHLGLFKTLSKSLISLIFDFGSVVRLLIVFGIIAILIYLIFFFKGNLKEAKEERAKEQQEIDREILHNEAKGFEEMNKLINEEIKK